jgi:hypothetical protein
LVSDQAVPASFKFMGAAPSAYEKMLIQRANAALLTRVLFPGILGARTPTNYVDQRLATPKAARDVYHYDGQGRLLGWTRYGEDPPRHFDANGMPAAAKAPPYKKTE